KSLRTRSASSGSSPSSVIPAIPSTLPLGPASPLGGTALTLRCLAVQTQLALDALIALRLELVGQLRASRLHDPPCHHHVNPVGRDVVQDPLVVRDDEHPEPGAAQLVQPASHGLQ